jgi:serine phosphatase RsbU (regulator of sigma subunit)/anti-sigma regulatory factor (Ser/Thr protein kinase)
MEAVREVDLAHVGVEEQLDELLDRVRQLLHADTAAVLLLDADGTGLVATAARGIEEEVRQGVTVPLDRGFAGRIAADRRPVILDRVDKSTVVNPLLIAKGIQAMAGVPMIENGRLVGVLHVGSLAARRFTTEDTDLLGLVAERITEALSARLARVEREAVLALQRGLLPTKPPDVPGLAMSARYVPGGGNAVGGDWYDVFPLPSGGWGLVLGDVSGHGLHAAIVMGRVRSALRAYALDTDDPAEVLDRLNRKLVHFEAGEMATVLYARIDPTFEFADISSAGHLPPLLVPEDGPAEYIALDVDPPIGVGIRKPRTSTPVALPPGSRLCVYTDGLIERRGENLDLGFDRLRAAATHTSAAKLAADLMADLVGTATLDDDIALLVIERLPVDVDGPFELRLPAEPQVLGGLRAALRRWLTAAGVAEDERQDLVLAVGEATTNVVEHAYGPEGGEVEVRATMEGRTFTATVTDHGHWREARGTNRGRGTMIMQEVSDEVRLETSDDGTRVTITKTLREQP